MTTQTWLAAAGALLLVIALSPRLLRRLDLSSALLALIVGVVVGPSALDLLDPVAVGFDVGTLETAALVVVALALMASGLRVSREDLSLDRGPVLRLLSAGMLGSWLLTAAIAWSLLDVGVLGALLLGAVLAPTDPVVASSLVTGDLAERDLPRSLRRTMEIEAGANDGLALPLVLGAMLAITDRDGALSSWLIDAALAVPLGVAAGAAVGAATGRVAMAAVRHREEESPMLDGLGVALALLAVGGVHLLGGAAVLAVFAAAVALSLTLDDEVRATIARSADVVAMLSFPLLFALLGTMLPWSAWQALGASGIVFAIAVLVGRRPPVVPLVLTGSAIHGRSLAFIAWFGPLGAAAIYYAAHVEGSAVGEADTIYAAATLAVCASVIAHSVTATPAIRAFRARKAR